MSFAGIMVAGTIGALLGACAIYYIGIKLDEDRLRRWVNRNGKYLLMSEDELDSTLETFDDNGKKMVLFGRLIPTIRSLISLPAGLKKMNIAIFLLFTLIGTTSWNLLLAGGGVYLGQNWEQILGWVDTYSYIIYAILGGLLIFYVVKKMRKRKVS
jgi:membrane protein DedA with SNARE-associated domain